MSWGDAWAVDDAGVAGAPPGPALPAADADVDVATTGLSVTAVDPDDPEQADRPSTTKLAAAA